MMTIAELEAAGFKRVPIDWKREAGGSGLDRASLSECGLYLFVVGDTVRYVGKADKSLQRRLRDYTKPRAEANQRKVHVGINDTLAAGGCVCLYVLPFPRGTRRIEWGGLPIDRLSGTEGGLIEDLNPPWNPWNAAGRARRSSEDDEAE
jgi:hypothetical protein